MLDSTDPSEHVISTWYYFPSKLTSKLLFEPPSIHLLIFILNFSINLLTCLLGDEMSKEAHISTSN